jgi:hypothetical protein
MLDAGLPDGAMLSAVYRPWQWLRVHAGGGTNAISPGIRAGFGLVPFGVGPSFTVEGGWYFEGDANRIATTVTGGNYQPNAMAEKVGYQFMNLHLGVELGRQYLTFFLHGGMSYVRAEIHQANRVFGAQTTDAYGTPLTTFRITSDPVITALIPSFKFGLVVFFG